MRCFFAITEKPSTGIAKGPHFRFREAERDWASLRREHRARDFPVNGRLFRGRPPGRAFANSASRGNFGLRLPPGLSSPLRPTSRPARKAARTGDEWLSGPEREG